jgi:hypothetical protein
MERILIDNTLEKYRELMSSLFLFGRALKVPNIELILFLQ